MSAKAQDVGQLAENAIRWLVSEVGVETTEIVLEAVLGTNPIEAVISDVAVFVEDVVRAALDQTDEARIRAVLAASRAAEDAVADKAEADMLAARAAAKGGA